MLAKVPWQKLRYVSSVSVCYMLTLLFAVYLIRPTWLPFTARQAYASSVPVTAASDALATQPKIIFGTPTRIVIAEQDNGLAIDLPVDKGEYNRSTNSWSLSDHRAQYATPSMPPNDTRGITLIYGHNKHDVFGYLSAIHQNAGATAVVYTDNRHTFTYAYESFLTLDPNDVSVFRADGPPLLIVQTCSGSFFQYRQMFQFKLQKVDDHAL